jgi:2,3-bisphosphoglycerate-dependent phosphoglycerate mutase
MRHHGTIAGISPLIREITDLCHSLSGAAAFRASVRGSARAGRVKGREAAVIRVFLIRHGESESNAGLPSADPGSIPLTADGHRQAGQIARVIADVPALIVTSPYLRARQTAQPTISRFPATACRQWPVHEFTYLGDLHRRASTAREREPYARAYWDRADPHSASHGAESFTGLLARTADFLSRLGALESGPVVVFTHGLFMRAVAWSLLTGVTTPDQDQMRAFRGFASRYLIPNAGVVELRRAGNGPPSLLGGSTIHLPAALAPRPR